MYSPTLPRPHPEPPRELRFVVQGEPVPAQMATLLPGGGVSTKGEKNVRARSYRDRVRLFAMAEINRARWHAQSDDAFAVELHAFVGDARVVDCDNLAKNVLDGLKSVRGRACIFPDDRQVVELHVTKAIDRERPRLEILVRRIAVQ